MIGKRVLLSLFASRNVSAALELPTNENIERELNYYQQLKFFEKYCPHIHLISISLSLYFRVNINSASRGN